MPPLHHLLQRGLQLPHLFLGLLRRLRGLRHCRPGSGMVFTGLDKVAIDHVKRGHRFGIVGRGEVLPHGDGMLLGEVEMVAQGGVCKGGNSR